MSVLSTLLNKVGSLLVVEEESEETKILSNQEMLDEAHQEIIEARNLFSRVEDPDMVDYAILKLKAAEKRYNYLIKVIKNEDWTP